MISGCFRAAFAGVFLSAIGFAFPAANGAEHDLAWQCEVIRVHADRNPPSITSVCVNSTTHHVATGGDDHLVRIWDTKGSLVQRLEKHRDWVRCVVFSPDGKWLATAGNDRQILLWDAGTGRLVRQLAEHPQAITRLVFSNDSVHLATIGFEATARIYEVASGKMVKQINAPCEDMRAVAVSHYDSAYAAAGRTGSIWLCDVATGKVLREMKGHRQRVRSLLFSPDSDRLLSCGEDGQVLIWKLPHTGGVDAVELVARTSTPVDLEPTALPRQRAKVLSLAFVGMNHVATGCSDNLIRIWDLEKREQVGTLVGHTGSVATLCSEGDFLVSGSFDTTVRVWKIGSLGEDADRSARLPTRRRF